jgi:amino acid transporter
MKDELQNYMGRPKRYNNIDGTGEMGMGIFLLSFALLNYLQTALPAKSMWRHGFANMLLFFAGVLLMLGLILWITKAIKKHITWPRTGYVAFRRSGKSSWKAIAFAAVGGAGSVCLFELAARHNAMNLAEAVYLAVLVGAYAIFIYRFSREHPWKWLVVIFMALGLFAMTLIVPSILMESWWFPMLFFGLVWLASGGATLYLYIRHTQPPDPEAE